MSFCVHLTDQTDDQCGFANIYITNDDGVEQVFTVKHLRPQGSSASCDSPQSERKGSGLDEWTVAAGQGAQAMPLPSALDMQATGGGMGAGLSGSFAVSSSLHPLPAMGVLVWDAMPLCGEHMELGSTNKI